MSSPSLVFRSGRTMGASAKAALAFLVSLCLCSLLIGAAIRNRADIEKMAMERLIMEKAMAITEVITTLLFKTQALSALVIDGQGRIENFERVAATIANDPAIKNILIAPDGVVSDVYPRAGNEEVLGYNLLGPGAGNREAAFALEKDQLVFGGPFTLVQGGQALVGRLPVCLPDETGRRRLWGLVSVTLHYPQALEKAGLESLASQGFVYDLWRVNPDDGRRQIIATSRDRPQQPNTRFIEKPLDILNARWHIRISPVYEWYQYRESWMLIIIGLAISGLIAVVVRNNAELKAMHSRLETMVLTDSLTGLLNRQGLFTRLDSLISRGCGFDLYYFDLNYFKQINDVHGHNAGDEVLREFARRVEKNLDPGLFFARIGGDEFVLIALNKAAENDDQLGRFWARLDQALKEPVYKTADQEIRLSFSRGRASFPAEAGTIDDLISLADKNMYLAKRGQYEAERKRRSSDWAA